jgi:hypothetical protein
VKATARPPGAGPARSGNPAYDGDRECAICPSSAGPGPE